MVRLGKTFGNLMVDLRATNEKLRHRTNRIVREATGLDRVAAKRFHGFEAALDLFPVARAEKELRGIPEHVHVPRPRLQPASRGVVWWAMMRWT